MKRKLLLMMVALIGLGQTAWAESHLYIYMDNSTTKEATLRYDDYVFPAYATYTSSDLWIYDLVKEIVTLNIDASCQNIPEMSLRMLFSGFTSLTTINNISNLKTSTVTNMEYMFQGCSSLTSLDLSSFNTAHTYSMNSMFSGCSGLTSLNLSTFNTESVTNMNSMFKNCTNLETITFGTYFKDVRTIF